MSLNAMAKEWAPVPASAGPPPSQWPTAYAFLLVGHERQPGHEAVEGLLKCLRHAPPQQAARGQWPAPALHTVKSQSDASQLITSVGTYVRETGMEKPCCSQGLFLSATNLLEGNAKALSAAGGVLMPLRDRNLSRDWSALVEVFNTSGAALGIATIGYVITRHQEYLVATLANATGSDVSALTGLTECLDGAGLGLKLAIPALLGATVAAVASPRACLLEVQPTTGDATPAHNSLLQAIRDTQLGQHPATVVESCALGSVSRASESLVDRLFGIASARSTELLAGAAPVVTVLTLSLDASLLPHVRAETLGLVLEQLRDCGLHPCVAVVPSNAEDIIDSDAQLLIETVRTKGGRAKLSTKLWPTPTVPSAPSVMAAGVYRAPFPQLRNVSEAARILDYVAQAMPSGVGSSSTGSSSSSVAAVPARACVSAYLTLVKKSAEGGVLVRRNYQGARVLIVYTPNLPPTAHSRGALQTRLFCVDPSLSVALCVPPQARTSPRSLPVSGITIMEAVLAPSHLVDQWKIVATDLLVWGGESVVHEPLSSRVERLTRVLEVDHSYNFRAPSGIALVCAELVKPREAYAALLSPKAPQVDGQHLGVVIETDAPRKDREVWAWFPPESTTCCFNVRERPQVAGQDAQERVALFTADGTAFDGEFCDIMLDTVPRTPVVGDVLQALLRRDSVGHHWWDALRLFEASAARRLIDSPFSNCDLVKQATASLVVTSEEARAAVDDPYIGLGDIEFMLRAADAVCVKCGQVSDAGSKRAGEFYCSECAGDAPVTPECKALVERAKQPPPPIAPLQDRDIRAVVSSAHAARDEHLRVVASSQPVQRPAMPAPSKQPSGPQAPPPPYVAATASIPQTLTLQWPTAVASSVALAKVHAATRASLCVPQAVVVDLCCGNDALVEFWLRDSNCRCYVAVDANPAIAQLVEGKAAVLRGPPRVCLRDEAAAKPQAIHHTAVCADAFSADFWKFQLPRCLPPGIDAASVITCFRLMPLHGSLSEPNGASEFFGMAFNALLPSGVLIMLVADFEALLEGNPGDWASRVAPKTLRLLFKRPSAVATTPIEMPILDLPAVDAAAEAAGFTALGTDFVAPTARAACAAALGRDIPVLDRGAPGAVVNEESAWALPNGASGAFNPTTMDESARFLDALRVKAYRRA